MYIIIIFLGVIFLFVAINFIIEKCLIQHTKSKYCAEHMTHVKIPRRNNNGKQIDGQLSVIYRITDPNKCILFLHGNATCNNYFDPTRFGEDISLITFDYSGYGESTNSSDVYTLTQDAHTIFNYIDLTLKIKPEHITIVGESLGGAVATSLVYKLYKCNIKIKKLILLSTFSSLRSICCEFVKSLKFLSFLILDPLDTKKHLTYLNGKLPITIMHSRADEIIPYEEAIKNCSVSTNFNFIELIGSHNHNNSEQYVKQIIHKN